MANMTGNALYQMFENTRDIPDGQATSKPATDDSAQVKMKNLAHGFSVKNVSKKDAIKIMTSL